MPSGSLAVADLSFAEHGAEIFPNALSGDQLRALNGAFSNLPSARAGIRLYGIPGLRPFLAADGAIGKIAAAMIGSTCFPVRAILFDKTEEENWTLGWHQDRTIAVKRRVEVEGFGRWTVKDGMTHVEPPFELLASMATLRVHLDPVPEANAPLLVAPGSHAVGRISDATIAEVVRNFGAVACLAEAGDVWCYATPILHASKPASAPSRRRVLQVDFASRDLPGGLEWLGI